MGRAVYPHCCLTWNQTMVEVMNLMAATLSAPNPAAGHLWPIPPPETPGYSQASLGPSLVGVTAPFSWVLVHTRFCFCPPRVCFPSSVCSVVGLMVTTSKRVYASPRSAAPGAPAPAAGHCWSIPPQETLKHSKAGLVQALWGFLVCKTFCLNPLIICGRGRYRVWF